MVQGNPFHYKEAGQRGKVKRKRLLSMKEKGEALSKLDAGMAPVAGGNFFNICEPTVRGIRGKCEEICFLKDAQGSSGIQTAHITHPTSRLMVTKEHCLKKYIGDKSD